MSKLKLLKFAKLLLIKIYIKKNNIFKFDIIILY